MRPLPIRLADESNTIPHAWRVVVLLFFVGLLNYLDRLMLVTMRLSMKETFPMSDAQFGLLTTTFLLVYALLIPFAGFVADCFDCGRIITLALLSWSATTWLTGHASTFAGLLATRVLMAVAQACYLPAAGKLIARYHRHNTLSLANGIHLSGVMLGSILSGFGGWLAERHGWRFPFELFGIVGVVYSVLLIGFLREPSTRDDSDAAVVTVPESVPGINLSQALLSLLGCRNFMVALLFYALLGITSWAYVGWMPTYLSESFHLTQGKSGLLATGFIGAGSLIGMISGGVWADRWSRTRREGPAWVGLIGLGVCVPSVYLIAHTGVLGIALSGLVLFGLTKALPDTNLIPILFQIVDRRYRATGLGLLYACGTISGGITIYLGGALRDAHVGINTVFLVGMVGMAASAALLWIIRPRSVMVPP